MDASIITAIGAVLTAVALVITQVALITTQITGLRKINSKVDEVQDTGKENHKMLNQQRTDSLNYQRALIRALEDKGIAVPIDQSISDENTNKTIES